MSAPDPVICKTCGVAHDDEQPAVAPSPSSAEPSAEVPEEVREAIETLEKLEKEATPGPWRPLENIPGANGTRCGVAPEGHATVENACDPDRHLELMGPLILGQSSGGYEWGSGSGSHLARVTWPPADGCRERALANVALIVAMRNALPALLRALRGEKGGGR